MSDRVFSRVNPYILLIITGLFWGGNAIAGKLAVGHISPFMLTTCRWILAVSILLPFAWKFLRKDWSIIKDNIVFLCICGVMGFTLFNNFLYLALTYTSAINVAIEQASMPLIVFILNYIFFRTPTTFFQLLGFAVTMIGVTVTAARGDIASFFQGEFNIGDILMIIAIMIYGGYSVALRKKPNIHLMSFLTILAIAALAASIPFTIYEASTENYIFPDIQGWLVVLYAGIFPSILAQLFWGTRHRNNRFKQERDFYESRPCFRYCSGNHCYRRSI